jgi:hypothetical protein
MKQITRAAGAIAVVTASFSAWAATGATVLFSQKGAQIFDERGMPRRAIQGDVLETGERLVTPPGAITQIKLPDGSIIGLRPGTEVKIEIPPGAQDRNQRVVFLSQGAARVIGAELMDRNKRSAFTLNTGSATVRLQGADMESAVVKPDAAKTPGATDPGSYNRLLIGTGSIGTGIAAEQALTPRQVSFVGTGERATPVVVGSVSPTLFNPPRSVDLATLNIDSPTKPADLGSPGTRPNTVNITQPNVLEPVGPTLTGPKTTLPIDSLVPPPAVAGPVSEVPKAPSPIPTLPLPSFTQPIALLPPPTNFQPLPPPPSPPKPIYIKPCTVRYVGTTKVCI